MNYKQVVTSFIAADKQILLLRRSNRVGTHQGQWSAVSGYLEGDEEPLTRAVTEIREELGLADDLTDLVRAGETLRAFDKGTDTVWVIHPFLFKTKSKTIKLDWENVEYRWVHPPEIRAYDTVPKLRETFDRVRYDTQADQPSLTEVLRDVKKLGEDRVHGANFLGRQAVALLAEVARVSDAADSDALFSQLLLIASRLRRSQPAMANVWNLTGMLLHIIDQQKDEMRLEVLKGLVGKQSKLLTERSAEAAEEVARISVKLLQEGRSVLAHSYSSTVLRSLELSFKGGRDFNVYATESHPGMEGKQLANDLIALGIHVTLIADSAVNSVMDKIGLVLVGADSVLKDGSLAHKIGTREIAVAAKRRGIPLFSLCEVAKFSVQDFLGERPNIPSNLFDVTPAEFVSGYVTEEGELAPAHVESRIRELQKEVYA